MITALQGLNGAFARQKFFLTNMLFGSSKPVNNVESNKSIEFDSNANFKRNIEIENLEMLNLQSFNNKILMNQEANLDFAKEKQEAVKGEVRAFFTKDQNLLNQYYDLRHKICTAENGWNDYNGSENNFDREGKIVIVTDKSGKVVGGARFMLSNSREYLYSETPEQNFTYRAMFKAINLNSNNDLYSEVSSFVMDPTYRDRVGSEKMMKIILDESLKNSCHYIVGVSFLSRCRNYRIMFNDLGYKLKIVTEFPWIEKELYNYVKTFPMVVPIRNKIIN